MFDDFLTEKQIDEENEEFFWFCIEINNLLQEDHEVVAWLNKTAQEDLTRISPLNYHRRETHRESNEYPWINRLVGQ